MPRRLLLVCLTLAVSVSVGGRGLAQAPAADDSTPAHISALDGAAWLEREGQEEEAELNTPLLEGDRLRTEVGRLELLLPDGSVLDVDRHTRIELLAGGIVRLLTGRLVFVVSSPGTGGMREYQVEAPAGAVRLTEVGEYRVATLEGPERRAVQVSVVRGEALLAADRGSLSVRANQRASAGEGEAPSAPLPFDPAQPDAFYDWANAQRTDRAGAGADPYLPDQLDSYAGTFDRYGTWQEAPEYGWVWYPRVAVEWRPYYYGSWRNYSSWGWTWIGLDPWAWPTHHYGRWGYGVRGWFWIPSHRWGPAWVAWGAAPGYLSWCPLGFGDRPVFSFGFGISSGRYSPWRGWTVVPRHAFGRSFRVSTYALDARRLPPAARSGFALSRTGPGHAGVAVSRSSVTGRAIPRAGVRGQEAPGRQWSTRPGVAAPSGRAQAGARAPYTPDSRMRPYSSAPRAGVRSDAPRNGGLLTGPRPGGSRAPAGVAPRGTYRAAPGYAPSRQARPSGGIRGFTGSGIPRGSVSGARPSAGGGSRATGARPSGGTRSSRGPSGGGARRRR